jgi:hypothetical protein
MAVLMDMKTVDLLADNLVATMAGYLAAARVEMRNPTMVVYLAVCLVVTLVKSEVASTAASKAER